MFKKNRNETQITKKSNTEDLQEKLIFNPRFDIYTDESSIYLEGNIPGASEDTIDISVEKGVLSIYAKTNPISWENYHDHDIEFEWGDYRRSFQIGHEIDTDHVEAAYKNGVINVRLPIQNAIQKKIPVSVS